MWTERPQKGQALGLRMQENHPNQLVCLLQKRCLGLLTAESSDIMLARPGFQSKCWMRWLSQDSWVWFAVLSQESSFQTWNSTIKTYSSQQGNKTELPADSIGMGISEEAVRECQRERVNGQMMTILREKLQLYALQWWKKELNISAIQQREKEKERYALLNIRQVQQRQQLRDGLKPDTNLNTLLRMKTAGSPQQMVQGRASLVSIYLKGPLEHEMWI